MSEKTTTSEHRYGVNILEVEVLAGEAPIATCSACGGRGYIAAFGPDGERGGEDCADCIAPRGSAMSAMPPHGDFNITGLLNLSKLVMKLGEEKRITRHPSGQFETDTTHTTMLALSAGYYACAEGLDTERVLFFALAHDMVEAYAGDTPTLHPLNAEEQAAKDKREADALERIWTEVPWLGQLIEDYERQDTPEARFVHMMDKAMPRLTHAHNACRVPQERGLDLPGLLANMKAQTAELAEQSPDLPFAKAILDAAAKECEAAFRPETKFLIRALGRDIMWLGENPDVATINIFDAGVFTRVKAEQICGDRMMAYVMVPIDEEIENLQATVNWLKEKDVRR